MRVGRLKRIVVRRETRKGIIESIGKMVRAANELLKEIPRMQAYGRASNAVFRNVEVHKMEHFMKLIDMGLEEDDPVKGSKLLETVKEIVEAYGKHRGTPFQKELLAHVKHVGKTKDPEMLLALGEVARHIRRIEQNSIEDKHAKIILDALARARTSTGTIKEMTKKKYTEWMLALKEHLEKYRKGRKEDAIRGILELITAQK